MKTVIKLGILAAGVAAGVAAAKRLKLAERGAQVFDQAIDKAATVAEDAITKTVELIDKGLTKADELLGDKPAAKSAPDAEGVQEAEQSAARSDVWAQAIRETGVGYPQNENATRVVRPPFGYGDVQHDGEGAGTR